MDIAPETRDVLRKAKGLVTKGWFGAHDGHTFKRVGDGNHCVMTAILHVSHGGRMEPACGAIRNVLGLPLGGSIPNWNNAPERTHEEVVAAFDLALGVEPPSPSLVSPTKVTEEVYA
jgi:hypothetical protein